MSIKEYANYVVVDLETTGCDNSDEIIEIGALRVENHAIVQSFSLLCKPTKLIPIEASEVNHITDEMVDNSPNIDVAITAFSKFIRDDDILIGHNISAFDIRYLKRDFKAVLNKELNNQLYDTLFLSRREMKFLHSHSLQTLSVYYGIDYSKAHRAVEDCFINYQVYEKMLHDNFDEANSKMCPKCGERIKLKLGKYGWFYSCGAYPMCDYHECFNSSNTKPLILLR